MKNILSVLLVVLMIFTMCACSNEVSSNGVAVSKDAFPEGTEIEIVAVSEADYKSTVINSIIPIAEKTDIYEITAKSEGASVQPNGKVKVSFPIPEEYNEKEHKLLLYYVSIDGKAELISSKIDGATLTAELEHFSTYVVVVAKKDADETRIEPTL